MNRFKKYIGVCITGALSLLLLILYLCLFIGPISYGTRYAFVPSDADTPERFILFTRHNVYKEYILTEGGARLSEGGLYFIDGDEIRICREKSTQYLEISRKNTLSYDGVALYKASMDGKEIFALIFLSAALLSFALCVTVCLINRRKKA